MNLWAGIKIRWYGRKAYRSDFSEWRDEVIARRGRKSFISGSKNDTEAHHLFFVSDYPSLAFSVWNGIMMTAEEHRLHPRSYHSWEGKITNPLLGIIARSPVGLLWWRYFHWHWWQGWGIALFVACGIIVVLYDAQ